MGQQSSPAASGQACHPQESSAFPGPCCPRAPLNSSACPEVQLCSLSGTTGNFCRISLHLPRIPCTQQQQVKEISYHLSLALDQSLQDPDIQCQWLGKRKKKKKVEGEKHIWCSAGELVLLKGTLAIELRILKVLQRTPQNWTRIFLGCSKVLKSYLCCLKPMPHKRGTLCSVTPLLCFALKD